MTGTTGAGADLLEGDVELTEFEALDVKSIKGVKRGANGFPILLMKGLPDAAKADARAHEPFTGTHSHEHPDGDGGMHSHEHFHDGSTAHGHAHAGKSGQDDAAGDWEYPADSLAKESRKFSASERKDQADEGNALPDGSYPIPDKDALRRAAILARSGHGDVAAAKRLIARRARELGVANPLDDNDSDDTSKSASVAEGDHAVDTGTEGTGLSKAQLAQFEDVLTKANEPLTKRIAALEAANKALGEDLAKVKATPVPGGPVMSVTRPAKAEDTEGWAAKAARYDELARTIANPSAADGYRKLAADARAKITT